MDALSDVLRAVRLSGAFFFDVHACAPWVAETPLGKSVVGAMFPGTGSDHLISYHALLEGSCWFILDGQEPVRVHAGDIVVLPHGDTHVLATEPGLRKAPNMSLYRMPDDCRLPTRISVGTEDGEPAHFVCGFLACDSRPYNPLLTALPRLIRINDHASGALGAYFRAALAESTGRMGGECMLGRISELMFVDVVRRYLESLPEGRMSWLAGLRRSLRRARTHGAARTTGPQLDHRVTGADGRTVAVRVRRALRGIRGASAHAIPDELAHAARDQLLAQWHRGHRRGRESRGL